MHRPRQLDARGTEQRGREVNDGHGLFADAAVRDTAGQAEDHRHLDACIVGADLPREAVLAPGEALVGGVNDERVVELAALLQRTTQIADAESKRLIGIKWRLRPTATGLKVRDVVVENISMTLNQRREFAAVLRQRNGSLDGLTSALREKMAEIDRKP